MPGRRFSFREVLPTTSAKMISTRLILLTQHNIITTAGFLLWVGGGVRTNFLLLHIRLVSGGKIALWCFFIIFCLLLNFCDKLLEDCGAALYIGDIRTEVPIYWPGANIEPRKKYINFLKTVLVSLFSFIQVSVCSPYGTSCDHSQYCQVDSSFSSPLRCHLLKF